MPSADVKTISEMLPVHFLALDTGICPDSVNPYFLLGWPIQQDGHHQPVKIVLVPPGIRSDLRQLGSICQWITFFSTSLQNYELIQSMDKPFIADSCDYIHTLTEQLPRIVHQPFSQRRQIQLSNTIFSLMGEVLDQLASSHVYTEFHPSETKSRSISSDGKSIIYATRYIRKNMSNPDLSLQDIANVIGYNSNYFCYKFSCILNISPIRFLKNVRLEHTLQLLKHTDHSISSICRMVGIRNPSSLSSLVKSSSGLTPMEYRMKSKQRQITSEGDVHVKNSIH